MIREAQRSELPAILELWLESTTWGHPFIKANYWRDCIPLVRDAYLANAQNWVWEEDGKFLGFVSIMEGRFLAAMFVAPKAVRRGIGKALMQYVQQRHPRSFVNATAFRFDDTVFDLIAHTQTVTTADAVCFQHQFNIV